LDVENEMKASDKRQQLDADECSLEKLGKLVRMTAVIQ